MAEVDFEGITKTPYGRYRLVCAADLIGEIIERGWIEAGAFSVNRDRTSNDRRAMEEEHEFEQPDREDSVDIALALMVHGANRLGGEIPPEDEIAIRKLLVIAYDQSDRFGA